MIKEGDYFLSTLAVGVHDEKAEACAMVEGLAAQAMAKHGRTEAEPEEMANVVRLRPAPIETAIEVGEAEGQDGEPLSP